MPPIKYIRNPLVTHDTALQRIICKANIILATREPTGENPLHTPGLTNNLGYLGNASVAAAEGEWTSGREGSPLPRQKSSAHAWAN